MDTNIGQALSFDNLVIDSDGQEFTTLPEGDYNYTVTGMERGFFPGSAKMQPSPKMVLTLQVQTDKETSNVREELILNQSFMWKLAAFFRSIGQKKHGEPLKPNLNAVVGAQGRAHFGIREYTDKNGNHRKTNTVSEYYDYDPRNFNATAGFTKSNQEDDLPF